MTLKLARTRTSINHRRETQADGNVASGPPGYGFTAASWFKNIGRRAVAYRKPDGGLCMLAVKLD